MASQTVNTCTFGKCLFRTIRKEHKENTRTKNQFWWIFNFFASSAIFKWGPLRKYCPVAYMQILFEMRKVSTRAPNLQSWRQTVSIRLVASCSSRSQYWLSLALGSSRHSQLLPARHVTRYLVWGVVLHNGFSYITSRSVTVLPDSYTNSCT